MFVKGEGDNDDDKRTAFQKTLHCAKNVLMSKIISSDKDLVGVILFGTGKSNNSSDFPNVYDLQCLDMPDADRILQLEEMEKSETFDTDYGGHSESFALSDALWYVGFSSFLFGIALTLETLNYSFDRTFSIGCRLSRD